jgi:hypothetical protein
MEFSVIGNANFCLDNPELKLMTYSIKGTWSADYKSANVILSDGFFSYELPGYKLVNLISEIKGCSYDLLDSILKKNNISFGLNLNTTIQELDLIKSLFNLFYWFDYTLCEDTISILDFELNNNDNEFPKAFNEFVIDMPEKTKQGPVKDIYLIKEEYHFKYKSMIDHLIKINLLSEFTLESKKRKIKNYFIPLTKPTYRTEIYGPKEVLEFYKMIINDRHICLTKHFNQ